MFDAVTARPLVVPRRRRRWRRVLAWSAAVVTVLVTAVVGIVACACGRADVSTAGQLSFENPLRIPDLLEGERGADGVLRFNLDSRPAPPNSVMARPPTRGA